MVIEGPAGIGKTRLLEAVCGLASDALVRVAWARASELESDYGFGVLRQLLEHAVTSPGGCLREGLFTGAAGLAAPFFQRGPAPAAPVVEPDYATLHGLYWLLTELAEEQPIALCVDDVQWADPPSLRFLSFAARRLANLGVTIFATLRSGDVGTDPELVAQLTADSGVLILRPRPLSGEAVAALARQELALEPSSDLVEACLESTGGNPFYLRALFGELAHEAEVGAGTVRQATMMGSDQIGAVLLRRLDALPAGAKELARALAVLGNGSRIGLVASLAELDPLVAEDVLRSLVQGGFLVGRDGIAFTHPIVRSSVYGTLSPDARSRLHRRAAQLVERQGARVEEVATHLTHALPAADFGTVATLRAAARSTGAVGAPESAAGFLKRALLEPPAADDEAEVLLELGRVEMRAGMGAAIGHLEEVIKRPGSSPAQRGQAALDLGEFFMHALRGEEGIPVLEAGLEATVGVEPALAKRLEATLIFNSCGHLAIRRQLSKRLATLKPPVVASETDPARLLYGALAYFEVSGAGKASEAIFFAEQCLRYQGPMLGSTEGTAIALALCGMVGADRPVEAEERADRILDIARASGSITLFSLASANRTQIRHRRGNLPGAESDARALLAIESYAGLEVVRPLALAAIVDSLCMRGDFDAAEAAVASIDRDRAVNAPTWLLLLAAIVDLKLATGKVQEALKEASEFPVHEAAWGDGRGVGLYEWSWRLVAAHSAAGQPDAARALADEQLELAHSFGSARALGVALRTTATLDIERDGIEMLGEAVTHLPQERSALERARTLVELGAALRRSGHRADAREPLHEAIDLGRRCGALLLARRAHTELRAAGGHPRSPLRTGLDGLTPSERRVAEMAADGLTNKEVAQALFVTVKTVEMHLANVFRKLGIGSRSQLQDALLTASRRAGA